MLSKLMFRSLPALGLVLVVGCKSKPDDAAADKAGPATDPKTATKPAGPPTPDEAKQFVADTIAGLLKLGEKQAHTDWVHDTYITEDTDALSAAAAEDTAAYTTTAIQASVRYKDLAGMDADTARALELLRRSPTLPYPTDEAKRTELSKIAVKLSSTYGKGKYCSPTLHKWAPKDSTDDCLTLDDLSTVLQDGKASWDELVEAWTGWRTISVPMRADYQRFVELGNEGAKEIGYADVGALWKSRYDMSTEDMERDTERLWQQVKPLYTQLRCYAGKKLRAKWGEDKVPKGQPLPAHLFGNMWSQSWDYIYPILEPYPGQPSIDATPGMEKKGLDAKKMTEIAEGFFVSLGMPELPETFWERSMLLRPRDREVVCHASAWPVTYSGDVRIKMCIKVNQEDLVTLHHELGHVYYYLAYQDKSVLFQDGANDGFHEAIGDTIAQSVTPKYLADRGILDAAAATSNEKADMNLLMQRALEKVAFLPFGFLIDKWRWDVFSGKIPPDGYNKAWWDLVAKYQGMAPPSPRDESFFDPGAKYHIPANTPYLRYFLAAIYQFQFHRALCKAAGHTGPLHTCSIFGNKEAGGRLWKTLQMGASKPWQEAMEVLTGQREADASAMVDYFAPLMKWLETENQGETCEY
jgi:peptidyl-dipeptidase A